MDWNDGRWHTRPTRNPKEAVMEYPARFVQLVKETYPVSLGLHKAIDAGAEIVGRYLDDSCGLGMGCAEILLAFYRGEAEKVRQAAKRDVRRHALYRWWLRIAYPDLYGKPAH
jgi:hypothetical protein